MPTKYRATRTEYDGVTYDSKAEAKRAQELDRLQAAGEIDWYIRQPRFTLGVPENVYRADFLVVKEFHSQIVTYEGDPPRQTFSLAISQTVYVEDVKGYETPKFKRDKKLWKRYGPCPLHIIKPKGTEIVEGGDGDS